MISCPQCEGRVDAGQAAYVSEILECAECLAELEVVSLTPLLVALAPEVEEDWGE
jgi:alpha-aminoadipate carrier protein LysW